MKRLAGSLLGLAALLGMSGPAWSAPLTLYGNNATGGSPYIYAMDPTTGAVTHTYTNLSGINGRGVVIVGNTMYYTTANSGNVFSYNLTTNTDNGALFPVAGASALSTMAFDGTDFWIGDYSGTNKAYKYSTTGTLLKTVTLSKCSGNCDGLEFFLQGGQGRLISNEGDPHGPYDVYDTNGTLLTASFITRGYSSSGIAFDGTDFYVSDIFSGKLAEYDSSGTFIKNLTITGYPSGYSPLIEDLSFNYQQTLPPPPPHGVPEPSTLLLLGSGMTGLFAIRRLGFRKM